MVVLVVGVLLTVVGAAAPTASGVEWGATAAWPTAREANAMLGRGLEPVTPLEIGWANAGLAIDVERAADLAVDGGFDSIRLPTRLTRAFSAEAPYELVDPGYVADVAAELQVLTDHGLTVSMVCLHCLGPEYLEDHERLVAVWTQIAELFADQPPSVFFELGNEPFSSTEAVNAGIAAAIPAIRASNPDRIVIVPSRWWSPPDTIPELVLPDDDHLIATFHHYDPMPFTHQGSYFPGSDEWIGTTWSASPDGADVMKAYLEPAVCWSRETGVPLYMGEFGVLGAATHDVASSSAWLETATRLAEAEGISWAYFALTREEGSPWDPDTDDWIPWMIDILQPPVDEPLEPWADCDRGGPSTTTPPAVPTATPAVPAIADAADAATPIAAAPAFTG